MRASSKSSIDIFLAALGVFFLGLLFICPPLLSQANLTRTLSFYSVNTKETSTVTYKKNGHFIPSGVAKLNWAMRDWRRNKSRQMDKRLFDLLWSLHHELGSQKPIWLISGYRSLRTNNKLRRTKGGQARRSRHILGMAADVHFPDIPIRELRNSALIKQSGGVGYYPTSALPFVHVDVGRVRHWPRQSRKVIASLFPSGKSLHVPSDGRPITPTDARKYNAANFVKKMQRIQLARRSARDQDRPIIVAAKPPAPSVKPNVPAINDSWWDKTTVIAQNTQKTNPIKPAVIAPPVRKPILVSDAPTPLDDTPTTPALPQDIPPKQDLPPKQEEIVIAKADPETSWPKNAKTTIIDPDNIVYSPEFDEEHPEELNYRPFPLASLMGEQPISHDTSIGKLAPPDYAATRVVLRAPNKIQPVKFHAGLQITQMKKATKFTGTAVLDLTEKNPQYAKPHSKPQEAKSQQ